MLNIRGLRGIIDCEKHSNLSRVQEYIINILLYYKAGHELNRSPLSIVSLAYSTYTMFANEEGPCKGKNSQIQKVRCKTL